MMVPDDEAVDRATLARGLVVVCVMLLLLWAVLATVIWDDVHMREFVRDCDASGGRVVVAERAITCVGTRP